MNQVAKLFTLAALTLTTSAFAGDLADELGLIELEDTEWMNDLDASDFDFMTPELQKSMADLSDSIGEQQKAQAEALRAKQEYERSMQEMTAFMRDNAEVLRSVIEAEQNTKPRTHVVDQLLTPPTSRLDSLRLDPTPRTEPLLQLSPVHPAPPLHVIVERAANPTGTTIWDELSLD